MSGGVAFVLDRDGSFAATQCNQTLVDLDPFTEEDVSELRELIENHVRYTESALGQRILDDWEATLPLFVKVIPRDYKAALKRIAEEGEAQEEGAA